MADIYLVYRVLATNNEVADFDAAKSGLDSLVQEVIGLLDETDFKNESGESIEVSYFVGDCDESDEYDGVFSVSGSILVSGGLSEYDQWEADGRQKSYGTIYSEELADADWMPFRELVRAYDNDLGKGVVINFDCLNVTENWRDGGYWFNNYMSSVDVRTPDEVELDRVAAEKRLAAQRAAALKLQEEKEERRKKREPLIQRYKELEKRYSHAFRFVNADHAIAQGIRISASTPEALRFLETANCKKTGGKKFKYKFKSLDILEETLNRFELVQHGQK